MDHFSPATEADFAAVVALRKTLLGDAPRWNDPEYLKWRYDFSEGSPLQNNRFWVFRLGQEVVAGVGVEHYQLAMDGEIRDVYQSMDILVRPELDGKGLGAWMNLALFEKLPMVMAVGTNDKSRKMVGRLFHVMPDRQVWKLPLRTKATLRRKVPIGPLADLLSVPADVVLGVRRSLNRVALPANVEFHALESFPESIDFLVDENCRHGFTFTARTSRYLNWRFCRNPRRQFSLLGMYQDARLVGYSVSRLYQAPENDQTEGVIVDWFCDLGPLGQGAGHHSPQLGWLLQETVKELEKRGAKLIHTVCYDTNTPTVLRNLGFSSRPLPKSFSVHCNDHKLQQAMAVEERWFLSEANCDTDGY